MKLLLTIIVTFFAGMGAGLGTGFAGMSAAAVISPMARVYRSLSTPRICSFVSSRMALAASFSRFACFMRRPLLHSGTLSPTVTP